jgi:hypothetical protein
MKKKYDAEEPIFGILGIAISIMRMIPTPIYFNIFGQQFSI